jgi:glycosyltransferase involved in cell wall biosynthesis
MKSLLYIGNKLSGHGATATAIETLGRLLEREGFAVVYASSKKNALLRFADMAFTTISQTFKADFVLIDTYSTLNFWYALAVSQWCRVFGMKYIPVLHGGNLPSRLENNPLLSRMIFNHAKINVAPSGYLFTEFKKAGYKNLAQVPNPIALDGFVFKQREILAPKLLWVRSLSAIYNPKMALEVLAILSTEFPQAELHMVGPDKDAMLPDLEQFAQQQNLNVVFTGRLEKTAWAKLSESCDFFVNTSRVDNAPFSIVEAAALGLAIVSTNVGGIPFLLKDEDTALLVNDGDANAMAKCISKIVNDNSAGIGLIRNARLLAAQSDWQLVKHKWLEILE